MTRPDYVTPEAHDDQERRGEIWAESFRRQLQRGDTSAAELAFVLSLERSTLNHG